MSCFYCVHYQGLHEECLEGHQVETGSESIECEDYLYNGGCNCE